MERGAAATLPAAPFALPDRSAYDELEDAVASIRHQILAAPKAVDSRPNEKGPTMR